MTQFDDSKWYGGRTSVRDYSDEYVPGDKWECKRDIDPVVQLMEMSRTHRHTTDGWEIIEEPVPFRRHKRPRLRLIVTVWGKRYGNSYRLRPTRWSACFEYDLGHHSWRRYSDEKNEWGGRKTAPGWHGTCTSVVDARRQAEKLITPENIVDCLKSIYAHNKAIRVFRRVDDEWVPFMSCFCTYTPTDLLPYGDSLSVKHVGPKYFRESDSEFSVTEWDKRGSSTCGHGVVMVDPPWWGPDLREESDAE